MKKISFTAHILPHFIAVVIFLVVTVFFFGPVFFENKVLNQHDITQSVGAAKALHDYRDKSREEGLWTPSMFSGMPAYLVNVQWSNQPVLFLKKLLSLGLLHPVANIFLAFISYYIMLLAFRVKPYLAIAGALAFGLSSYMIIGIAAGHNARIGAIAFMPLVVAGIHLVFSGMRILGFGVTAAALALHLRENHLQITYYLLLIVFVYGFVQLVFAIKENKLKELITNVALLLPAAILGAATFFGPMWAINEYSAYSIRGKSDLVKPGTEASTGLRKDYAFEYSNGILEPLTLVIPNFYGGSSMQNLFADEQSALRKALNSQGIQYDPRQMVQPAYWGPQSLSAPYYGGAIIFFLFVLGVLLADKKYVWWLVPLSLFAVILTWGSNFASFNYFMFDYFPGYNKFRSVTFAIIIALFTMPLLGILGLQLVIEKGITPSIRRQLVFAISISGGLCLLVLLGAGMFGFLKEGEAGMPGWFIQALRDERKSLMQSDAFRSLIFMGMVWVVLYFDLHRKISTAGFYAFLVFFVLIDMALVDRRYFGEGNYQRKSRNAGIQMSEGDQQVLADKSYFRVMNINGPMNDAITSFYHNSIGGYHGAKLRRYQDLYDSCISREYQDFITSAQAGRFDFSEYPVLNMLNTKYLMYGQNRENVIPNPQANGNAWFVSEVIRVESANEELSQTCSLDSKTQAVIDVSLFSWSAVQPDSTAVIRLTDSRPNYLRYEASTATDNLAVLSEVYYPQGWHAFIDGKEVSILRANYILRALVIPAGQHVIELHFQPDAYLIGNKVTLIASWLLLIIVVGCVGWSWRRNE